VQIYPFLKIDLFNT